VVVALSRFYDNVINIGLQVAPYLPFEAELHTPLLCGHRVLQFKWHFYVVKTTKGGDECGGRLVHLSEGYLVITLVGVQET
jgi:hypothetical protein